MSYWEDETPIEVGSKFYALKYFPNAKKLQVIKQADKENDKPRLTITLGDFTLKQGKEIFKMISEIE